MAGSGATVSARWTIPRAGREREQERYRERDEHRGPSSSRPEAEPCGDDRLAELSRRDEVGEEAAEKRDRGHAHDIGLARHSCASPLRPGRARPRERRPPGRGGLASAPGMPFRRWAPTSRTIPSRARNRRGTRRLPPPREIRTETERAREHGEEDRPPDRDSEHAPGGQRERAAVKRQ